LYWSLRGIFKICLAGRYTIVIRSQATAELVSRRSWATNWPRVWKCPPTYSVQSNHLGTMEDFPSESVGPPEPIWSLENQIPLRESRFF
jgi:hypothetical protein